MKKLLKFIAHYLSSCHIIHFGTPIELYYLVYVNYLCIYFKRIIFEIYIFNDIMSLKYKITSNSDFFADDKLIGLNNLVDGDTEFIPLISPEDEDRMNLEEVPEKLPILPLRNNVLFPGLLFLSLLEEIKVLN